MVVYILPFIDLAPAGLTTWNVVVIVVVVVVIGLDVNYHKAPLNLNNLARKPFSLGLLICKQTR
jgi:hypothetical protein